MVENGATPQRQNLYDPQSLEMASLRNIKSNGRDDLLVSGFMRKTKKESKISSIPTDIFYAILSFFYIYEYFDKCGKELEISEDKTTISTIYTGDKSASTALFSDNTGFGHLWFNLNGNEIAKWRFRINDNEASCMNIVKLDTDYNNKNQKLYSLNKHVNLILENITEAEKEATRKREQAKQSGLEELKATVTELEQKIKKYNDEYQTLVHQIVDLKNEMEVNQRSLDRILKKIKIDFMFTSLKAEETVYRWSIEAGTILDDGEIIIELNTNDGSIKWNECSDINIKQDSNTDYKLAISLRSYGTSISLIDFICSSILLSNC